MVDDPLDFFEKAAAVWYFEKPFEKSIIIFGLIALIYSIIRIIIQGVW